MGMSASQVRLLSMTARVHDIENEAERIQNQKMLLANQSDEAYIEYLNALEQKNIQAAVFSPETGTFKWEEIGLQGLFDNGYALKVNGFTNDYAYTVNNINLGGNNSVSISGVYATALHQQNETNFVNSSSGQTWSGAPADINLPNLQSSSILTYKISNEQQLLALAQILSTNQNIDISKKTFILDADINMTNVAEQYKNAIASGNVVLKNARFLGNGHTISGLKSALFSSVENTSSNITNTGVYDLKIQNTVVQVGSSTGQAGVIANTAAGEVTIDNCYVTGAEVNLSKAGSIIGETLHSTTAQDKINIKNTAVDNTKINSNTNTCGGFVGTNNSKLTIDNSASYVRVIGGFVGTNNNTLNISDSITLNDIYLNNNTSGATYNYDITGHENANGDGQEVSGHDTNNIYKITIKANVNETEFSKDYYATSSMTQICNDLQSEFRALCAGDESITVTYANNQIIVKSGENSIDNISFESAYLTNLASVMGYSDYLGNIQTPGWIECESVEEVRQALGATTLDGNSPALLRDLIANAMAIICTYDPDVYDENGKHIYTETSVTVDTKLREVQNDADMAKAEANYEAALRKIDQKDKKYDKELAAIENERKAVLNQMETFKSCIKENIDRTFKIFNG